jgi:hypothetical protein
MPIAQLALMFDCSGPAKDSHLAVPIPPALPLTLLKGAFELIILGTEG